MNQKELLTLALIVSTLAILLPASALAQDSESITIEKICKSNERVHADVCKKLTRKGEKVSVIITPSENQASSLKTSQSSIKSAVSEETNTRGLRYSDHMVGNLKGEDIKNLLDKGLVSSIYPNLKVKAFLSDSTNITNATSAWDLQVDGTNITGKGQSICVVDTGIAYNHSDLGNCTPDEFSAGNCEKVPNGTDFVNNDNDPMDDNGHGTHVAGISAANGSVKGMSPDADLLAVKSLNASGTGSLADVSEGIGWCVDNSNKYNITSITLSLGTNLFDDYCDNYFDWENVDADPMTYNINKAVGEDIAVAAATGNHGNSTHISYPSCIENATRVGATNDEDDIWFDSNTWGNDMLVAPGTNINSTYIPEGDACGKKYCQLSGTSMAAPHVSGAVALMNQYLEEKGRMENVSYIESKLNETGRGVHDETSGNLYPRIDVYDAVEAMGPNFDINILDPTENENFVQGKNVTVNYTIQNTGDEEDAQNITFKVLNESDSSVDFKEEEVTLGSGESYEDNFTWNTSGEDLGEYEINLYSDDDKETVFIDLIEEKIFHVEIDEYNEKITLGDETQVNYTVESTYNAEETQNITFNVTNETDALVHNETEEVTLNSTGVYSGNFTWNTTDEEMGDYTFNISSEDHYDNVTVSVLKKYNLTIEEPEGEGVVLINGSFLSPDNYTYREEFFNGTTIELKADPSDGWNFRNWTGVPSDKENDSVINPVMDQNRTLKAHFFKVYNLTVNEPKPVGGGNITVDGTSYNSTQLPRKFQFANDTEVSIVTKPNQSLLFNRWEGDVESINKRWSNDTTIQMDDNYSITARFSEIIVKTLAVENITNESARLHGNLTDIHDNYNVEEINVSFRYKGVNESIWNQTEEENITELGEFNFTLQNLTTWKEYKYQALGNYTTGEESGLNHTFITQDFVDGKGTEENPYVIENWEQLNGIRLFLDDHFVINSTLNEATEGYDEFVDTENGWNPIGSMEEEEPFKGTLDGKGHEINSLYINNNESSFVGLFNLIENSQVSNLSLSDVNIESQYHSGSLAGLNLNSNISDVKSTGSVKSEGEESFAGGLIAVSFSGKILNSTSSTSVSAPIGGGILGFNLAENGDTTVSQSYSTGFVSGGSVAGGLVGVNEGQYDDKAIIKDSYSTSNVSSNQAAGGLVGKSINSSIINRSYGTGHVEGAEDVGALVGLVYGEENQSSHINNSYTNNQTTGQDKLIGGITNGEYVKNSTSEILSIPKMTNYTDEGIIYDSWDLNTTWNITAEEDSYGQKGYPHLSWQEDNYPYPRADPLVYTYPLGGKTTTSAYFEGEVAYTGAADEVNVSFIWKEQSGSWENITVNEGLNGTSELSYNKTDLQDDTTHKYYTYAEGESGEQTLNNSGKIVSFTTLKKADFRVDITSYDNEVEEGDTITVDYEVENIGDIESTKTLDFEIDGDQQDSEEPTLGAGESTNGYFSWVTEQGDSGDHDLTVLTEDDQETKIVTVSEVNNTEDQQETQLPDLACDYTDWEDEGCGESDCESDEMYQTRSSTVDGCDDTERCEEMTDTCGVPELSLELGKRIVNVTQGGSETNEIEVENTGTEDLEELVLHIEANVHDALYTIDPLTIDLDMDESSSFEVNFTPDDLTTVDMYKLTYRVNTTGYYQETEGELWVQPKDDAEERITKDYEKMNEKVKELESKLGERLNESEELNETAKKLRKKMDQASEAIEEGDYLAARERLDEVEELYPTVEEEVEKVDGGWSIWLLMILALALGALGIFYYFKSRRRGVYGPGSYTYRSDEKKGVQGKLKSLTTFSSSSGSQGYSYSTSEENTFKKKLNSLKQKWKKWKEKKKQTTYEQF